jgi:hypothetical protein
MDYKSILTNWLCKEISRNVMWIMRPVLEFYKKWRQNMDFERSGIRFFLEEVKKYTFGKSNFKTFCKNRKSEILPPFLSTLDT